MLFIIQFEISDWSSQIIGNWSERRTYDTIMKEGTSVGPEEWFNWKLLETLVQDSEVYKDANVYWFKRATLRDNTDKVCLVKTRLGQTAPNPEDVVVPMWSKASNGVTKRYTVSVRKNREVKVVKPENRSPWDLNLNKCRLHLLK